MKRTLLATSGPLQGARFELGRRTIIGRAEDSDVQVLAEGVSRQHAALIENDEGELYLMDLASKNGTFVEGQRILRLRLELGVVFRVSSSAFTVTMDEQAPSQLEQSAAVQPGESLEGDADPDDLA